MFVEPSNDQVRTDFEAGENCLYLPRISPLVSTLRRGGFSVAALGCGRSMYTFVGTVAPGERERASATGPKLPLLSPASTAGIPASHPTVVGVRGGFDGPGRRYLQKVRRGQLWIPGATGWGRRVISKFSPFPLQILVQSESARECENVRSSPRCALPKKISEGRVRENEMNALRNLVGLEFTRRHQRGSREKRKMFCKIRRIIGRMFENGWFSTRSTSNRGQITNHETRRRIVQYPDATACRRTMFEPCALRG